MPEPNSSIVFFFGFDRPSKGSRFGDGDSASEFGYRHPPKRRLGLEHCRGC